jgi:phosphoribosylglycinamide formyltransferase-1
MGAAPSACPRPTLPPRQSPEGHIDIAVLASGSGTNVQALIDAPSVRPHIVLVASDNPQARALERARHAGIPTSVIPWSAHRDRTSFSTVLADVIEESGAKGVVLAGFMRILGPSFVERFTDRVLNIHPSLLPAFPGAHAVEDAVRHGVTVTGLTIHFVDEEVDHGPIVAQVPVQVEADDTPESLHERIQAEEHDLYPRVVEAFVQGRLTVEGRRVVWH